VNGDEVAEERIALPRQPASILTDDGAMTPADMPEGR